MLIKTREYNKLNKMIKDIFLVSSILIISILMISSGAIVLGEETKPVLQSTQQCRSNLGCLNTEFCKFEVGFCNAIGVCMRKPEVCPFCNGVYCWDPVCGCNEITYSNECIANSQGVSIKYKGACIQQTCKDYDNGLNFYVKASVLIKSADGSQHWYNDQCLDGTKLRENYCNGNNWAYEDYSCPGSCSNGVCIGAAQTCKDYDNGLNFYVKASVLITESSGAQHWYNDACTGDGKSVYENYCDGNNWKMETYPCPNGCSNGACITATQTCKDYDDGLNFYVKSSVLIKRSDGSQNWYNDACTGDGKSVYENYCSGNVWKMSTYACPVGCSDGKCIVPSGTTCIDYDNGKNYNTKSSVLIKKSDGSEKWYNDACTGDGKSVYENYCKDASTWAMETYTCPNGCSNGQCNTCSCTSWTNGACGTGGCASNQKPQTRTCTPSGCSAQLQCVDDLSCGNCHDTIPPGDANYCNINCKCNEGEGDCDSNSECNTGLICVAYSGTDYCERITQTCYDYDNGKNYNTKSSVLITETSGTQHWYNDQCIDGTKLRENYCNGYNWAYEDYSCPSVCSNGQCIICSCTAWVDSGACGTGGCDANQKPQTRTCTPSGCQTESQCITDSSCGNCHGTTPPGADNYCNINCKCNEGEGDCDSNSECNTGLTCVSSSGTDYCELVT